MHSKRNPKWYDSDGQRSARRIVIHKSNPTRTLIGLIFMLGLVILLLQQLTDTEKVTRVGQAIGLFEPNELTNAGDKNASSSSTTGAAYDLSIENRTFFESLQLRSDNDAETREQSIWTYFLSRLATEQQDLMVRYFLAPKSNLTSDDMATPLNDCTLALNNWLDQIQQNQSNGITNSTADDGEIISVMLARIEKWRTDDPANRDLGMPFRIALDRVLLRRFLDNQNWMSKEQVVALRTWARIREMRQGLDTMTLAADELPIIELSQLLGSENATYRAVPLRFLGSIASVDERTGRLQSEGWNGVAYRVWWMKPKEVSSQPVAVYVPIELEPSQFEEGQKSELEITGFFAKRKAYASQRGPEIAPVIFAAAIRRVSESPATRTGDYAKWLANSIPPRTWSPPIDLATPIKLIKSTIESMPSYPSEIKSQSSIPEQALSLLMVAQKHEPELRTLAASNQTWDVSEQVKIGSLSGWCKQLKALDLEAILSNGANSDLIAILRREGFQTIYELAVQTSSDAENDLRKVYVKSIPEAWRFDSKGDSTAIQQPIELIGFLCQAGADTPSFAVCDNLSWKLSDSKTEMMAELIPEISPTDRYLLERGWNLSQRDVIQQLQSPAQPLSRQEEEGLFSLLRIAALDGSKTNLSNTFQPTPIVDIVKASLSATTKTKRRPSLLWTECNVRVVRVTRINLDAAVQRHVLGQDYYYQLDCFADIGNVTFEIPTDTESISYAGEYPITCIATKIPDSFLNQSEKKEVEGDSSLGDVLSDQEGLANQDVFYPRVNVKINGWFYRFWSYRTQEMTQRLGLKHRQVTPLVIVSNFTIDRGGVAGPNSGTVSTVAWFAGLMTVGAVWWAVRSYGKSKTDSTKRKIRFTAKRDREP